MSAPGLKKYETIVVTRTDAGHEAQRRLYDKVTDLMAKGGARHIRFEFWGKRRLAYQVAKANKALYLYYLYLADGDFVRELNRTLKLSNIVLRYLTVNLAHGVNPETYDFEKEKQFDALPSDADEGHEHRPQTGWESEYPHNEGSSAATDDDDDDDDEEEVAAEASEKGAAGEPDEDEEE